MQLTNGYEEPAGPGEVAAEPQLTVPLATVGRVRAGNEAVVRQTAQLIFSKKRFDVVQRSGDTAGSAYGDPRYGEFSLRAHPVTKAQLGWVLSEPAFDDMVEQPHEHRAVLNEVAGWRGPLELRAACVG